MIEDLVNQLSELMLQIVPMVTERDGRVTHHVLTTNAGLHSIERGVHIVRLKISKKYNIGVIDLKFTQYIPMMVSDIVYKCKSDQTSMTSIIEIEILNLVWLNLRSLLTNNHLAFCDYLHQSWNMRSWFCLSGNILIFLDFYI